LGEAQEPNNFLKCSWKTTSCFSVSRLRVMYLMHFMSSVQKQSLA